MTRNVLIYVPKPASVGGMEMHLVRLAQLYAANGAHVTIVATGNSLNQRLRVSLAEAGVCVLVPNKASKDVTALDTLIFLGANWFKLRLVRWDLILTNAHSFWAFVIWSLASPGTRIAHHHHTTGDTLEQNHWSFWYFILLQSVPLVLSCSGLSSECIRVFKRRGQVVAMPYLVDPILVPGPTHSAEGRSVRLGYIGRLVKSKGIDRIIEMSERSDFPEVDWVLYGSLGDYSAQDFADRKHLRYCGTYSTSAELTAILHDLDAVVLFTEHVEGMPVCLLEAAAAGLPWIASDIGGVRELSKTDERNQLVPRGPSLDECAQAVRALLRSISDSSVSQRPTNAFKQSFSYEAARLNWKTLLDGGNL